MSITLKNLCLPLLLLIAAALASAAPQSAATQAPAASEIDACVTTALQEQGAPGGALALAVDGDIVLERSYGTANLNTGEPVTTDTLFRPGSVQKMMTSAAVLLQLEQGRLNLDDSVQVTIPELQLGGPWSTRAITVRDLLTHTSGIPDMSDGICTESLSEWAGNLAHVPHFAPAGTFFNYTNAGYSLAGLVAERADARPYAQLMREAIWRPAGMDATFQTPAEAMAHGHVSWGHEPDEQGDLQAFPPDTFECPWAGPSGDFFTTASDLLRFPLMLMQGGGSVLSADTAELLVTPAVPTRDDPGVAYGLGVIVRHIAGQRVLYHSGGVPGGSSYLLWLPEADWGVSVVANRAIDLSAAAHCVLEKSQEISWPESPGPRPPHTWTKFQGLYAVQAVDGESFVIAFWMSDGQLMATGISPITGEITTWPAVPTGPNAFWVDIDEDGDANGLELVSFVTTRGAVGRRVSVWLRNRLYVGLKTDPVFAFDSANAEASIGRFLNGLGRR